MTLSLRVLGPLWLALGAFFTPSTASAREAASFLEIMGRTLSAAEIYLAATTPFAPLITTGNQVTHFAPGT